MMEGTVQLVDEEGNIIAITGPNKDPYRIGTGPAKNIKAELGLSQGQFIESNGQLYQIVQVPAEEPELSVSASHSNIGNTIITANPTRSSSSSSALLAPLQNVQTTLSFSSPSLLTLPTASSSTLSAESAAAASEASTSELRSRRHEILSRRPSYRRILNELSPGFTTIEGTSTSTVPSAATVTVPSTSSEDALAKSEIGNSEGTSSSAAASSVTRSTVSTANYSTANYSTANYSTANYSTANLSTSVGGMVAVQTANGQLALMPASSLNLTSADFAPSSPNTLVHYNTSGGPSADGLVSVSATADTSSSSDEGMGGNTSSNEQYELKRAAASQLEHSNNNGGGHQSVGGASSGSSGIALPIGQRVIMTSSGLQLTSDAEITGRLIKDTSRKREVRLFKNREAARECRRKKKEYVRCLENRVAVLETQNKALIEELKSLKDLYCNK